jgi:hypothetical protein
VTSPPHANYLFYAPPNQLLRLYGRAEFEGLGIAAAGRFRSLSPFPFLHFYTFARRYQILNFKLLQQPSFPSAHLYAACALPFPPHSLNKYDIEYFMVKKIVNKKSKL